MIRALSKWGPWAALAVVAVVALAVGLGHPGPGHPSLDARTQHIAAEVRCPVCDGETVAESQAAPSVAIRDEIRSELQAGRSDSQILAGLVADYGPGILEKPPAAGAGLVVWAAPVAGFVVGGAVVVAALLRWRGKDAPPAPQPDPVPEPELVAVGAAAPRPEPVPAPAAPPSSHRSAPRWKGRVVAAAGVAMIAGGASWVVVASSATRLSGQPVSGQALPAQTVTADLQAAENDESANNVPGAVKQYQKILAADPTQVQALAGEGWLLCQTGQPTLFQQGMGMLQSAEKVNPDYAPAHVYRGLALLGEADYADSVIELQWYLDHDPDPGLKPEVQKALAQAQARAKI